MEPAIEYVLAPQFVHDVPTLAAKVPAPHATQLSGVVVESSLVPAGQLKQSPVVASHDAHPAHDTHAVAPAMEYVLAPQVAHEAEPLTLAAKVPTPHATQLSGVVVVSSLVPAGHV